MSVDYGDAGSATVTMIQTRLGEDGVTWWEAGQSYAATVGFARHLVAVNCATATFIAPTSGWEDLRFPSSSIDPAGSTAPASRDTATGMLIFAGNADNVIAGIAQLPHSWQPQTILRPHVHLAFPNANEGKNTRWKLEINRGNANEDFEHALGTYSSLATITVANPNATGKQVLASFGNLDMTGYRESSCILWRVSRLAASDAADNDTGAATLLEFDIHYIRGKDGTPFEIPT